MPSDPKALIADIQKVLKEHNIDQARVSLDLFEGGDGRTAEDIQIYMEQHPNAINDLLEENSPSKNFVQSTANSKRLLTDMQGLRGAAPVASPKNADAPPKPASARGKSPEQCRTHMSGARRAESGKSPVVTTTGLRGTASHPIDVDEDVEPRQLDSTVAGVEERVRKDASSGDTRRIGQSGNTPLSPELMAAFGMSGGNNVFKAEEQRSDRIKVLQSWVGKSTLLDDKKQKEKLAAEPPKQFISSKVDAKYSPSRKNLADGNREELPELAQLTPRLASGTTVPSSHSLEELRKENRVGSKAAAPPGKSLKEMLAEQRAAELRNREGLRKHEQTMEEARRYMAEVDADPERRELVEFIKNPLTKKTPTPPSDPRPNSLVRSPNYPSNRNSISGIQVKRVTLPDEEKAKEEVLLQLGRTATGREHLSSKDRYNAMLKNLESDIESSKEKEQAYKQMLEAAIKYNEKLGIKEGSQTLK